MLPCGPSCTHYIVLAWQLFLQLLLLVFLLLLRPQRLVPVAAQEVCILLVQWCWHVDAQDKKGCLKQEASHQAKAPTQCRLQVKHSSRRRMGLVFRGLGE
jgi:hypothetical protein